MALNFLPRGSQRPGFSLDRRDLAHRRSLQRKEVRLLLLLPVLVLVLAVAIQGLLRLREALPAGPGEPVIAERVLNPMPPPRLYDAAVLPTQAAIDGVAPVVAELVAAGATVRHEDDIGPATLAWADHLLRQDLAAPPLPAATDAHDLVLGDLPPGAPITTEGLVLDAQSADAWLRLVVDIGQDQYLQVLARPTEAVVIGRRLRLVGRYLGTALIPSGTTGDTVTPLALARVVHPLAASGTEDQDLAEFRTGFPRSLPDDLYHGISDERNILERRPYYTLLGQAKLDRDDPTALAAAGQGNALADHIHQDPDAFRGRLLHVTGRVYRAWEDPLPARDQPYGITRVIRILLWNRDLGRVTEIDDGKPRFRTQILRLYEVALATDQPLPARGEQIVVTARFLKFRAIPVARDRLRDERNGITRQSDRVYPFTFVGSDYRVIPPSPVYEFTWVSGVGVLVTSLLALFLWWTVRRDHQLESLVSKQIHNLRKTRRSRSIQQAVGQPSAPK